MVKIIKDGVKNIYCVTCKKWMTDFYVIRHVHSKSHFTKKHFGKKKQSKRSKCITSDVKGRSASKKTTYEERDTIKKSCYGPGKMIVKAEFPQDSAPHLNESQNCKTPENEQVFELKGDTIEKRREHSRSHIESSPPDVYEKVKQRLFEREQEIENKKLDEIPQNILGLIGLENTWDIGSICDENQTDPPIESQEQSQDLFSVLVEDTLQNELPIEVVNCVFPELICTDPHNNQISYYKCSVCNPATYKDYDSW